MKTASISEADVRDIIYGNEYDSCILSLADLSAGGGEECNKKPLICHSAMFHSYDDITKKCLQKQKLPKSPDMILFDEDVIVFVEFKSGGVKPDDIKVKAIEGCFITLHKIILRAKKEVPFIDVFKLKKKFILVHQRDDNSKKRLHNHMRLNRAVRFGLEIYRNTFFNNIKTISTTEFMSWMQEKGFLDGAEKHG